MTNETRSAVALTASEMLSTDVEVLFQDPSGIRRGAALDWVKAAPLFDATWIKKTWAELSAITTASDGQGAMVIDGDAGTHTDPVVAGTVNNAGMYIYRATGTVGWERIADTLTKTVGDDAAAAAAAADKDDQFIYLTQTNSDGRLIQTQTQAVSNLPADGLDVVFEFEVKGNKTAGGATIMIAEFASGTVFTLFDKDGVSSPPTNRWLAGDTLRVRRMAAGNFQLIDVNRVSNTDLSYPDDPTALARTSQVDPVTPANLAAIRQNDREIDYYLQHALQYVRPTAAKQCVIVRTSPNRIFVMVPLIYAGASRPCAGDYGLIEILNIGDGYVAAGAWQDDDFAFVINSLRMFRRGKLHQLANFTYEELVGAGSNSGLDPSTVEFALQLGILGGTFEYAGFFHDHISYISAAIFIDDNFGTNYRIDANFPIGVPIFANKIEIQQAFYLLEAGGGICGKTDLITTIDPGAVTAGAALPLSDMKRQIRIYQKHDFSDAARNVTPLIKTGYTAMEPGTGFDMVDKLAEDLTTWSTHDIYADVDDNIALGKARLWSHYHSQEPEARLEMTLNAQGPMKYDGVQDTAWSYCDPSQYSLILGQDYGPWETGSKTYVSAFSQAGGSGDTDDLTDHIVENTSYYGFVCRS